MACTEAEKRDLGSDATGENGSSTTTDDSGGPDDSGETDPPVDPDCVLAHIDSPVLDRTGGDSLSIVLHCADATGVDEAEVVMPELDLTLTVSGSAEADGTTWKGESLSELEELVAEKGLALGMNVAHYDLDGELRVVPPGEDLVDSVRFHDSHRDFSGTVTDGRDQHTGFRLDIAQVPVRQSDRDSGTVDFDGDGASEAIQVWAVSVELDASAATVSVGLDACDVDPASCTSPAWAPKGWSSSRRVTTGRLAGQGTTPSPASAWASWRSTTYPSQSWRPTVRWPASTTTEARRSWSP